MSSESQPPVATTTSPVRLRYRSFRRRRLRGQVDIVSLVAEWRAELRQDAKDLRKNPTAIVVLGGIFSLLYALPLAAIVRALAKIGSALGLAVAGAPEVNIEEGEGTEEDIRALLARGKLGTADLVLLAGTWQPMSEAPPFFETCIVLERHARPWRILIYLLCVAVGIAAICGFGAALYSIPGWLVSLGKG